MKTLVTLFFFLFAFEAGFSQVIVNEKDINTVENLTYIELTTLHQNAKTTNAYINYGQSRGESKLSQITTPDNKAKEFNNEIDVLNFMAASGWELKQIITQTPVEVRYIMIKKQR
jgi:hypothetical protein